MRKTLLTAVAALAASSAIYAQSDNGFTVIPSPADDNLIMYSLSPNGRYVGGNTLVTNQAAVYDLQDKKLTIVGEEAPDGSADVRKIADDGKFVAMFSDTNTWGTLYSFSGDILANYGNGSLPKGLTKSGDLTVGAMMNADGATWNACYWDGTTPVYLPEPSEKWAGWTSLDPDDPRTVNGTSADFVSADKSVIVGYIIDNMSTYPAAIWRQNKDGKTYSLDFISHRYFDNDWDGTRPYVMFQSSALSSNGKWIAITLATADVNGFSQNYGFGRFNVDTETLETYLYDDQASVEETYASGIADDGTIVGFISSSVGEQGVIWPADEKAPSTLAEKYPNVPQFAEYDEGGHMVGAISADGRYISGYGYYYRGLDTDDESDDSAGYESYIFDRQAKGTTGIKAATTTTNKNLGQKKFTRYTLDGRKVSSRIPGFNILKFGDGRTVKTLEK